MKTAKPKKPTKAGKVIKGAKSARPVKRQPAHVVDFPGLPALVQYVRQGRCALFVGAGLSVGAGLPDWKKLMSKLIPEATPFAVTDAALRELERHRKSVAEVNPPQATTRLVFTIALGRRRYLQLFADGSRSTGTIDICNVYCHNQALERVRRDTRIAAELNKLLAAGRYPELAGYCRDLLGREKFHELVRRELAWNGAIPATHRAIVRTPFACVVTTNFDSLIENAYAEHDLNGLPRTPTGAELAQQGTLLLDDTFFVLKAHGDLDDESSIVFTSEDYRRVVHSNPAFQAMLTSILLSHAILFVGYSLSDVNFRLLLDHQLTIFNESVPPRYVLMSGVGEAEKDILWRTARLRVFSYEAGRHEVVGRFLTTLADRAGAADAGSNLTVKAPVGRKTLGTPPETPASILAVRAQGDRIILDLSDELPKKSPHRVWSGGCRWPKWREICEAIASWEWDGAAKMADANAIGAELRNVIPDDLMRHLDTLSPGHTVLLELSPETEMLPWEWLIVEGSPLCLRNPIVRRPVGISDKARGCRFVGTPLRALIIGDPGDMLPGAMSEARSVASQISRIDIGGQVNLLVGKEASYARLVAEVAGGDYDIIHFAGMAFHDDSEGLLQLADGRVSSSELASILSRRPPSLLVLNACHSAFVPPRAVPFVRGESDNAPGTDRPLPMIHGFTAVAARSGVGAFVGSFGTGLDEASSKFASSLYEQLLRGDSFAQSLHHARNSITQIDDITGMLYIGSGYSNLVFTTRKMER